MALMLSNLIRHQYVHTLIQYRLIGILLGGSLGLCSTWLITITIRFYYHNSHAIDHIKRNKLLKFYYLINFFREYYLARLIEEVKKSLFS